MSKYLSLINMNKVMKLFLSLAVLLSFGPFLTALAYTEEQQAEELGFIEIEDVYAAAKHLQSVKDAPSSISIVTDEDIRRYGHRTITDVLNNSRSFYTYSDRNYEYVGMRGFARLGDYGNRVLQLIDGHSNNDNVYGTFFTGHGFGVDMDIVKKIELIRGPGAALYGSYAMFGTVNVITKNGKDINGFYTKIEGGSYNTYSGSLTYGRQFRENFDLIMSASFVNSKGDDHYFPEFAASVSNGWARDSDGERARKFFIKAMLGELTFTANAVSRGKNVPTAAYDTIFNDNRFQTIDEKFFTELKWDHPFTASRNMKSRIFYDRYHYDGTFAYDYPPVTINRDEAMGQSIGGEVIYDQRIAAHQILAGGELIYHMDAMQKNYDELPYKVYLDDNHTFTSWSLFGQEEWDISSWLRFTGGLRFDKYSTFGGNLSPRAGLIIHPIKTNTVKLLYGRAFRAPNAYELYYETNTGASIYKDNPNLKPETINTYEIVVEQELLPAVKISASGFQYEAKDLISQQTNSDGSLQFYNVDKVRSMGLEVELDVSWPGFVKGHVSYTYQDTRDVQTGQMLANSPRHLANIGVRAPVWRDMIFFGGQCRYMGIRNDRDGDKIGDALITDIIISAEYKKINASAGAYNIFDTAYYDPVSSDHTQKIILQNGRNFWFKLGYVF